MKLIKLTLATLLMCVFSVASLADTKIAVFNKQVAIIKTDAAQQRLKEMQNNANYTAMVAKGESIQADIKAMDAEMSEKGMAWSQEKLAEHKRKRDGLLADIQLVKKKIEAEERAALQIIFNEEGPKLQAAFNQVVEAEGIDIVIDAQAIVFAKEATDITQKVSDAINKIK